MQAVNLIPADVRVGGGTSIGRSGGAVYIVLGGLAVLLVMMGLYALAAKDIAGKQAELSGVEAQVQAARAGSTNDVIPGQVRQERSQATSTVRQLAEQRMDWGALLYDLGRTLPANTSLSGLEAALVPDAKAAAVAPTTPGAPAAVPAPTMQLTGCAPSQAAVAELMPKLHGIPGVDGVQLVSSTIGEEASTTGGGATSAPSCTGAEFQIVLQLTPKATPPAAVPAAGTAATGAAPASATTHPTTTTP